MCMETIFIPTVNAMNAEGRPFKGCLYFGLMLTKDGPKVIEYNCRFGDPETQVVLPLLESDLIDIMLATRNGTLKDVDIRFSKGAACCVIMASAGYPESYQKGFEISLPVEEPDGTELFVAGATIENSRLVTSGGRVLGVTATAEDLRSAAAKAYEATALVNFESAFYRKDIGQKALKVL